MTLTINSIYGSREYELPYSVGDIVRVTNLGSIVIQSVVKELFGVGDTILGMDMDGYFPTDGKVTSHAWKVVDVKSNVSTQVVILLANRNNEHIVVQQSLGFNFDEHIPFEVIRHANPQNSINRVVVNIKY